MLETLFWVSGAAILHHHIVYPLSAFATQFFHQNKAENCDDIEHIDRDKLPHVTLIVPAFNEASIIEQKIENLVALNYPKHLLCIHIHCDGSDDGTPQIAMAAARIYRSNGYDIRIVSHPQNRGKAAVLNDALVMANSDFVGFSDVSAVLSEDTILRAMKHFDDPKVGVVGGLYDCSQNGSEGEANYWSFQNKLRLGEVALAGSPMGFSGAFFLIRASQISPLEKDTINDDFILPMRIIARAFRGVLDPKITISELQRTRPGQEFSRRRRLGAGNIQQMVRMFSLANPMRPGLAYAFVSGKALRSLMPFILALHCLCIGLLARSSAIFWAYDIALIFGLIVVQIGLLIEPENRPKPLGLITNIFAGYWAGGLGAYEWLTGRFNAKKSWQNDTAHDAFQYIPRGVQVLKRIFDIGAGCILGVIFLVLLAPIALAIKLDSKGPIFYRQLRVGCRWPDRTVLFHLIKFRTMYIDAEAKNGAVWATKNDSRITKVGAFLRKTRLDELPQALNVLLGDMSMIGPRPERPVFFETLETKIPFYSERTYGILPGITGLAQVRLGYDETIEDVRLKVGYDHAYAMHLGSVFKWFKLDAKIIYETILVMARGRGQ